MTAFNKIHKARLERLLQYWLLEVLDILPFLMRIGIGELQIDLFLFQAKDFK